MNHAQTSCRPGGAAQCWQIVAVQPARRMRKAVVSDVPGTTRDRIIDEADWNGVVFDVVDTGGRKSTSPKPTAHRQPAREEAAASSSPRYAPRPCWASKTRT